MSRSWVVDPDCTFGELAARLAALGFTRDATAPVTPDILPGEPELAAWTRSAGERLTYTFNPVVSLRVVGSASDVDLTQLPLLGEADLVRLLSDDDPRWLLLGLFATRVLVARPLTPLVESLRVHPDRLVRQAAESTLAALADRQEAAARADALGVLSALCHEATPVVAALVGAEGAAAEAALRPRPEDYAQVFTADIAEAARVAYDALWLDSPFVERIAEGDRITLRVDAAPAGMLRDDNELSRRFPGGYRALAQHLVPERIWFVWRYLQQGDSAGMRYDGLVRLPGRWVWFPKPYRVVGEILRARP